MEESDLIKANDLNPQKLIKPSTIVLVAKKEGTETNANQDIDESKKPKNITTESSVIPNKHKVKPGDTLTKIAKKYGISVDELKDINQIAASEIQIGSTLQIKRNN
jgi:LysM repeat protein